MKQSGKDVRVTFASFEKSKDWKRRENVCVCVCEREREREGERDEKI